MVDHISKTTLPLVDIEVGIAEPRVSIIRGAAPCTLGHVVVKVNIDALLVQLGSNCIKDLHPRLSATTRRRDSPLGKCIPVPWSSV